jgi:hypothetical protein
MKLKCEEISISDEEFGCMLTLSEMKDIDTSSIKMTVDDVLSSRGKYVLLQRTYGEEDLESDYCYIETSDFDKSGEFKDISMQLWRTRLILCYENELIEVDIDINEPEYEHLKNILMKIANKNGQLTVHD